MKTQVAILLVVLLCFCAVNTCIARWAIVDSTTITTCKDTFYPDGKTGVICGNCSNYTIRNSQNEYCSRILDTKRVFNCNACKVGTVDVTNITFDATNHNLSPVTGRLKVDLASRCIPIPRTLRNVNNFNSGH